MVAAAGLMLGGCVADRAGPTAKVATFDQGTIDRYGPRPNEKFALPASDISRVRPQYLRREVAYSGNERPGTIVVDTQNRYLFLVMENGRAMRYGIGVGKEGLSWGGVATIQRKAEWPRWTPTADMIARDPDRNAKWAGGMDGGLGNPLGPRAMYLYQNGRDTLYRIHGTTEPWTIGSAVSSGCIRLINQDVIDLYNRVPTGTTVIVLHDGSPMEQVQQVVAQVGTSVQKGLSQLVDSLPKRGQ
jgi:lipoprotein-anchoring transpeptidase ErfK/SrfK